MPRSKRKEKGSKSSLSYIPPGSIIRFLSEVHHGVNARGIVLDYEQYFKQKVPEFIIFVKHLKRRGVSTLTTTDQVRVVALKKEKR